MNRRVNQAPTPLPGQKEELLVRVGAFSGSLFYKTVYYILDNRNQQIDDE